MAFLDETGLTYSWKKIKLAPYPVGSIYTSANSTSPAELFGGTWEQLKDRFLLATGDNYQAGSTGGEAQHKLTVEEMPKHQHELVASATTTNQSGILDKSGQYLARSDAGGDNKLHWCTFTSTKGNGEKHNNMPPYLAVYMWKRIA